MTRPDVVRGIHDAYLAAGADCVETNTFGANLRALGEYGLADRIFELSQAGARLAREVADGYATPDRPRYRARLDGPRHQAADAGPHAVRHAARRVPAERRRPARRRRRRADRGDLPGPVADQGGGDRRPAGDRGVRP